MGGGRKKEGSPPLLLSHLIFTFQLSVQNEFVFYLQHLMLYEWTTDYNSF